MTYRKLHSAECSCCGHVAKTETNSDFISGFFLPDICSNCGETIFSGDAAKRNGWAYWIHTVSKDRFVEPVRTYNPLTWLRMGKWERVERYDFGPVR